jgi:hypothetical protein
MSEDMYRCDEGVAEARSGAAERGVGAGGDAVSRCGCALPRVVDADAVPRSAKGDGERKEEGADPCAGSGVALGVRRRLPGCGCARAGCSGVFAGLRARASS